MPSTSTNTCVCNSACRVVDVYTLHILREARLDISVVFGTVIGGEDVDLLLSAFVLAELKAGKFQFSDSFMYTFTLCVYCACVQCYHEVRTQFHPTQQYMLEEVVPSSIHPPWQ